MLSDEERQCLSDDRISDGGRLCSSYFVAELTIVVSQLIVASFPGPAQLSASLAVRKSGRGPGLIYHVSDIRVDLIERRRIVEVPTHVVDQ